jgi:hypothetical protein
VPLPSRRIRAQFRCRTLPRICVQSAGSIDPWVKDLPAIARVFALSLAVPSNRTDAGTDGLLSFMNTYGTLSRHLRSDACLRLGQGILHSLAR